MPKNEYRIFPGRTLGDNPVCKLRIIIKHKVSYLCLQEMSPRYLFLFLPSALIFNQNSRHTCTFNVNICWGLQPSVFILGL
jgi:hypothetical protein